MEEKIQNQSTLDTDNESGLFRKPVTEALSPDTERLNTPLDDNEEIEEQDPPRVNMTALVSAVIVAVCATIILCVARPWKNNEKEIPLIDTTVKVDSSEQSKTTEKKDLKKEERVESKEEVNAKTTEKKESEDKSKTETDTKKEENKAEITNNTLPLINVTNTGTDNIYNNVRLVDASSRLLTQAEVAQMSKTELALARNAIYARHGYEYNNKELAEFFSKQSWFKPTGVKREDIQFTKVEVANINLIIAQENKKK
ncbi:MAG: YARHG domain-containing protein [Bacteroidales bacterium]|nr:YARHG domain-containing protein [Bacteroidales bacterium]